MFTRFVKTAVRLGGSVHSCPRVETLREYWGFKCSAAERWNMSLARTVVDGSVLAQLRPLQFGGDFIELAILFLILALVAAVLGARGIAGLSMEIAKWLVIIFVVLAIITFVL